MMPGPYVPPPPHKIPESALPYIAALSEQEHALHFLATQLLGSSYFVETSHGFVKWQQAEATKLVENKGAVEGKKN
jgi:hypothetical protein